MDDDRGNDHAIDSVVAENYSPHDGLARNEFQIQIIFKRVQDSLIGTLVQELRCSENFHKH